MFLQSGGETKRKVKVLTVQQTGQKRIEIYSLRRLRGALDWNSPPLKLFDHRLGARIALVCQFCGFGYQRLKLCLHFPRLLHRCFEVGRQRTEIISFENQLHGLKREPDKYGTIVNIRGRAEPLLSVGSAAVTSC